MSVRYAREKINSPIHIINRRIMRSYLKIIRDVFDEAQSICGTNFDANVFNYALNNIQETIKCKEISFSYFCSLDYKKQLEKIGPEYFIYSEYISYVINSLESYLNEDGYVITDLKENNKYIQRRT
ncbi:MAG: hypothetical protein ACFFG0_01060 [Candidatus Thorarchaeota archaeon]